MWLQATKTGPPDGTCSRPSKRQLNHSLIGGMRTLSTTRNQGSRPASLRGRPILPSSHEGQNGRVGPRVCGREAVPLRYGFRTFTVAVSLLLVPVGSGVGEDTVAVFETKVPGRVWLRTRTTSRITSSSPGPNRALVHRTFPVSPGAGAVHDHPSGATTLMKTFRPPTKSVTLTFLAMLGPA